MKCVDDFGNTRFSRRAFVAAATPVAQFTSIEMLEISEWSQDDQGWFVLAVWRDYPDLIMWAYY